MITFCEQIFRMETKLAGFSLAGEGSANEVLLWRPSSLACFILGVKGQ